MRTGFFRSLAIFAFAALALPALSQTVASGQTGPCKVLPAASRTSAKLLPYTAEFKITDMQTLANGTNITRESTVIQARDSQLRTVSSTTGIQPYGDRTLRTMVNVHDPVAGTQSSWDSQSRKAKVIKMPSPEEQHGCWQTPSGTFRQTWGASPLNRPAAQSVVKGVSSISAPGLPLQPQRLKPVMEDLGTMTIEGVEARGQRWTTTIPVGAIGNDQPLVSTQENWFAMGLGLNVRALRDDPQQGKQSTELVKLDQGDPDPALFQPPEGYEVVTEEMVPCKEQAAAPQ
jgi:hypothetical protein